jgi:hypothetical protein
VERREINKRGINVRVHDEDEDDDDDRYADGEIETI